jgi:hypothetical protein
VQVDVKFKFAQVSWRFSQDPECGTARYCYTSTRAQVYGNFLCPSCALGLDDLINTQCPLLSRIWWRLLFNRKHPFQAKPAPFPLATLCRVSWTRPSFPFLSSVGWQRLVPVAAPKPPKLVGPLSWKGTCGQVFLKKTLVSDWQGYSTSGFGCPITRVVCGTRAYKKYGAEMDPKYALSKRIVSYGSPTLNSKHFQA